MSESKYGWLMSELLDVQGRAAKEGRYRDAAVASAAWSLVNDLRDREEAAEPAPPAAPAPAVKRGRPPKSPQPALPGAGQAVDGQGRVVPAGDSAK